MRTLHIACLTLALSACGGDDGLRLPGGGKADDPSVRPAAEGDWNRDLIATAVTADVGTRTATAAITVDVSDSRGLSLEVGDLQIEAVRDEIGALDYHRDGAQLDVGVPATGLEHTLFIDYVYQERSELEGAVDTGITLTWPYYCGNLFPCKSDPADGLRLELELTGVDGALTAVYPAEIPADAPSYMLAWAIGDYRYQKVGTTSAGTEVGVFYLPGGESIAIAGTDNLDSIFEWYETTLGAYTFGDRVASVAAPWGAGAFGGMEHHPFWHVGTAAMGDEETHAHEAAHGWFGNGVRIGCWEDFVLSEGTVSYLTARAIEEAVGADAGAAVWTGYRNRLTGIATEDAWPDSCGVIDILEDGLFSSAPYMKGAFFFKALAGKIGVDVLDGLLAQFYAAHVGGAATFQDLLDLVASETGYDPKACADAWLRGSAVPDADVCP